MSLIALDRETLGYNGHAVLRDVTLSIEAGERVALLGSSGAGKTTLIDVLYRRLAGRGAAVALVPQEHALVPALSVYHNVYMGRLERRGTFYNLVNLLRPWRAQVEAVRAAATPVGLGGILGQTVDTLSGGQKQRTAIARALFRGGDIVLADEPVSAVDMAQAKQVLNEMARAFGTIILASHDVELALETATRLIGLKDGAIVLDVPAQGVDRARVYELYRH